MPFSVDFHDDWDKHFKKLDRAQQERIWKKILKLGGEITARHLKHGLPYFVLEAGQYRIAFKEYGGVREVYFAGTHKQYVEWYSSLY